MPFTFLSHQAVVLPLKLAAPRRASGTGLVLGSMAPDAEYVIRTYPTGTFAHSWTGQIVFCLPLTLGLYWIVTRIVAPIAAANLPDVTPFRPRDYVLAGAPTEGGARWGVVAVCGLLGSVSHVLLDRAERALERILAEAAGVSGGSAIGDRLPTTVLVQIGGSVILALGTLALLVRVGERQLVRRSAEERGIDTGAAIAAASARRWKPTAFWGVTAVVAIASAAVAFLTRRQGFHAADVATWAHVWLAFVAGGFSGLVVLSALWILRARRVRTLVDSGDLTPAPTSSTSKVRR